MKNHICHLEIPVPDFESAKDFYEDAFGWKIEINPQMDYAMFTTEKEPGGGFIKTDRIVSGGITPYIYVDSIEETLKRIEEKGGSTVQSKTPIGKEAEMGYFALFKDPFGNVIGLYKEKEE